MDWTRASDKTNVWTFAITAIGAAVGLGKWLMSLYSTPVTTQTAATAISRLHPAALPVVLLSLLIVSFVFSGIAHVMARRTRISGASLSKMSVQFGTALSRKEYSPISPIQVVDFFESLRFLPATVKMPVRLVCTPKGKALGELIAKMLVVFNFDVTLNQENLSRIFPAEPGQSDGIVVRAQSSIGNPMLSALLAAIGRLDLSYTLQSFPPSSPGYNRIQIEIGDRSLGNQWE